MRTNFLSNIITATILFATLFFVSCGEKDPVITEQENLNTLKIKVGSSTFTWSDTDGAGGNAPKIDTIKVTPNGTFDIEISVQDGSKPPAQDYTSEVIAEKDEHLFIYKTTGNITVIDLSKDTNSKDFGQTAKLKSTTAGGAILQITLKHEADKSAADPSKTGETDIDVTFPVVIK